MPYHSFDWHFKQHREYLIADPLERFPQCIPTLREALTTPKPNSHMLSWEAFFWSSRVFRKAKCIVTFPRYILVHGVPQDPSCRPIPFVPNKGFLFRELGTNKGPITPIKHYISIPIYYLYLYIYIYIYIYRNPCFFFCCSVSIVVGSLKDEPGRR